MEINHLILSAPESDAGSDINRGRKKNEAVTASGHNDLEARRQLRNGRVMDTAANRTGPARNWHRPRQPPTQLPARKWGQVTALGRQPTSSFTPQLNTAN
jgi:hypothetical protein